MDISDIRKKAINGLFDKTMLTRKSCIQIVNHNFDILLEELSIIFDKDISLEWSDSEISDLLRSMKTK